MSYAWSETRPLRAVHVSFHVDAQRRDPETLLRTWPTLLGVAAAVARAGVEATVVQASSPRQTIERDGVILHFVDDVRGVPLRLPGGLPFVRRPSRLLACVAAASPDVVHVHGLQFPYAMRQLARALPGIPMVVQDHASQAPRGWRRHAWRAALPPLAGVAFSAREQSEPFIAARVLPADVPVFEVLEGSSRFTPGDMDAARRATGLSGDPCLLWTGHLAENKDPLTTLEAFEQAAPRLPDARLWCCYGSAPLFDAVRRRIESSSVLRDRVVLLGPRAHAEMEQHFRAADFFVQTSHREGCSYSTIEALACGTTPLVTALPSFRRLVGDAGFLTPVADAGALAAAIVAWAARDRAELRRAARARFETALAFDIIGQALRLLYERVSGRA
jgi:glycosyltransferase involved in cell wall biosynthesis